MNLQDIQNAIDRTRIVAGLEGNSIKRQAKLDALRLVEFDLRATYAHQHKKGHA